MRKELAGLFGGKLVFQKAENSGDVIIIIKYPDLTSSILVKGNQFKEMVEDFNA